MRLLTASVRRRAQGVVRVPRLRGSAEPRRVGRRQSAHPAATNPAGRPSVPSGLVRSGRHDLHARFVEGVLDIRVQRCRRGDGGSDKGSSVNTASGTGLMRTILLKQPTVSTNDSLHGVVLLVGRAATLGRAQRLRFQSPSAKRPIPAQSRRAGRERVTWVGGESRRELQRLRAGRLVPDVSQRFGSGP